MLTFIQSQQAHPKECICFGIVVVIHNNKLILIISVSHAGGTNITLKWPYVVIFPVFTDLVISIDSQAISAIVSR